MAYKLQSAMEYLMTYGWAILIIAVVLGALFQLGIFNASTFTPKAPPDACHVFRPNGPMTTSFVNLQGICNGELPQYVGGFDLQGEKSVIQYVNVPTYTISNTGTFSYFAWFNPSILGAGNCCQRIMASSGGDAGLMEIASGSLADGTGSTKHIAIYGYGLPGWPSEGSAYSYGSWHFVGVTYDGAAYNLYLDGALIYSHTQSILPATEGTFQIGIGPIADGLAGNQFFGMIANVQAYNASLTSNEVSALYQEGIGGAPVKLNKLMGWWPLNGDTKDYSGNNNNGQISGSVTFTSNWESGYSAP